MIARPDPLDDILREAHRRGQLVVMHPIAGPVFVHAVIEPSVRLAIASREALERLDQMTPERAAAALRVQRRAFSTGSTK